jgi:aryl-alcohol dehydrogenase-like predicted oxidoreductase
MMFGPRCSEAEAARIVDFALERGVDFIDTAHSYGQGKTEQILGRVIAGRRDRLFVATKVSRTTDADWVRASVDESLKRMKLEYVDLYMIHWPRPATDVEAMMGALDEVVRAGKARFVGCSNFPAWLLVHCNAVAERNGWAKLVCNQVPYAAANRGVEVEVLPQALAQGIAVTVYQPLMAGVLAGKYKAGQPPPPSSRGESDRRLTRWTDRLGERVARFEEIAAGVGLTPAQLAIAWVRRSPAVTCPIVGCSSLAQLEESIGGFEAELSDEAYAAVNALFDDGDEQLKADDWHYFPKMQRSFEILQRDVY